MKHSEQRMRPEMLRAGYLRQEDGRGEESLSTYPSLFEPGPILHRPTPKNSSIPDTSLYDESGPLPPHKKQETFGRQKTITIFGYSAANLEAIISRFRRYGAVEDINYGKNWIDLKYEDEKSMFKALSDNGKIINDEMVGVTQKYKKDGTSGILGGGGVFMKRERGAFARLFGYLFGE